VFHGIKKFEFKNKNKFLSHKLPFGEWINTGRKPYFNKNILANAAGHKKIPPFFSGAGFIISALSKS
jgi:hypothetical protein